MRKINRLISTFACAIAVLIWTCAPAQARFKGTLQRGAAWSVQISGANANTDDTAVTVFYLGDNVDAQVITTVKPGEIFSKTFAKIPRHVKRIIIEVDLPEDGSGSAFVVVSQKLNLYEEVFIAGSPSEGRWVFDVVDEP